MLRRLRTHQLADRQQSLESMRTLALYPEPGSSALMSPSSVPPPSSGNQPPQVHEAYYILPSHHFTLLSHLRFNTPPQGPQCNCGTWQMWCLPPHLGGCGHIYVQMATCCGKTIDDEQQVEQAIAGPCPGVVLRRRIRCAGYMMGLCPTCRTDAGVIQTYNNFVAPFFVPRGLTGMKYSDAEEKSQATWKAHRLTFEAWIASLKENGEGRVP